MSEQKRNAVNEALALPLAGALEKALGAALADEREVVLAMLDVDLFARVNKEFGLEAGDRVLIETGRYVASCVPKDTRLFRYGGDEFALLFPERMEKEEVFLLMERIRQGYAVQLPDGGALTVSAGIAAAVQDASTVPELIRKAEGALFRGKLLGRDRVCLAREEKMVTKTAHYTAEQLKRLTKVSQREGIGEAILLREALDALLRKYDV